MLGLLLQLRHQGVLGLEVLFQLLLRSSERCQLGLQLVVLALQGLQDLRLALVYVLLDQLLYFLSHLEPNLVQLEVAELDARVFLNGDLHRLSAL